MACELGVHEIPVKCGDSYVGQTARCLNDRICEHKRAVKNKSESSELAKHMLLYFVSPKHELTAKAV